jgi:DNA polymerase-3 subunit alpha
MAALMTSDGNNTDRLAIEISECKHMGIDVQPPSINESYMEFAVVPGKSQIRFALPAVKGVGAAVSEMVIDERKNNGKFVSIDDFAKRVNASRFTKKSWDALIMTGGFDEFADRSDLLFNLEKIQAYAAKIQKEQASGQADLFSMMGEDDQAKVAIPGVEITQAPVRHANKERLMWERDLMGLYISAHPLDNYDEYFAEQTMPLSEITPEIDGKKVTVGGIITSVRTILTKNNTKMAFVKLESKTNETEIIVFPAAYEKVGPQLLQDSVIRVDGRVNARDKSGELSEAKIIMDDLLVLTDDDLKNYEKTGVVMKAPKPKKPSGKGAPKGGFAGGGGAWNGSKKPSTSAESRPADRPAEIVAPVKLNKLYVHIKDPEDRETLQKIKGHCSDHSGIEDMILVLGDGDGKKAIKMPFRVDTGGKLISKLAECVGEECVFVK